MCEAGNVSEANAEETAENAGESTTWVSYHPLDRSSRRSRLSEDKERLDVSEDFIF